MNKLNIFAEITKFNEEERTVSGYASTEALDLQNERVSKGAIEKALPDYMKFKNIREMHQASAVGVAEEAILDEKGLYLTAKVIDDSAWKKVKEGVYKGFSIGGQVVTKVKDMITDLRLTEISLVDRPANPEAVFDVYKAADIEQDATVNAVMNADVLEELTESPVADEPSETVEEVAKGETDELAPSESIEKVAERKDVNPKEGEKKYGNVKFADPKNKKYPIDTEAHIRAAWNYIHQKRNADKYSAADASAIKRRIVAAWKAKIGGTPPEAKKGAEVEMQKGLTTVCYLAQLLSRLDAIEDAVEEEAMQEMDGSTLPQRLHDAVKNLGDILRDMVDEEVEELNEGVDVDFMYSEQTGDLSKMDESIMQKFADFESKLSKLEDENTQLKEKISKLEDMPEPAKAALKSFAKGESIAKEDSAPRTTQDLIKMAFQNPQII